MNLDESVDEDLLFDSLKTIQLMRGSLVIKDNPYLASLYFLRNVVSIGNLTLLNNPNLVDARLSSVVSIGSVNVLGSNRLCPARYPSTMNLVTNQRECVNLQRHSFSVLYTHLTPRTLGFLALIFDNAALFYSNYTVSNMHTLCCIMTYIVL